MRNASIDVAAAKARGVVVCGTPAVGSPTSGIAIGLMLELTRRIGYECARMKAGVPWQTTIGLDLDGLTLGVLGLGKLGTRTARIAQAFGMKVIAWSQNLTPEKCNEVGVDYVSKEDLFRQADFITIHVVLSQRSRGLVGAHELGLMKPSAYILNGGQVIVDYLVRERVPYVFGLCGHGNIGLLDALYERASDIKTISVHHETVAGFMADVYYRIAGRPVATFTSCGPGSANLPIAIANAFLDSVPFLAITGNVPTSQFNRGAFQELYRHYQADFPSTVRACAKRVFQPTRGDMVPLAIRQAWKTMVTGRPGPV